MGALDSQSFILAFSRMMVTQPLARQWGKQRVTDFVAAHPDAALRSLLDSTIPEEVHLLPQVVAQLQQPVMFLAGQQDPVMEPKYVYHLASFHTSFNHGCQNVIEIPNCGHMGMVEQPKAIADHIQTILIQAALNTSPFAQTEFQAPDGLSSVRLPNGELGVPNG